MSSASFNTEEAKQVVQAETYRWLLEYQMQNPHVLWVVMIVGAFAYCLLLFAIMKQMYVRVDKERAITE